MNIKRSRLLLVVVAAVLTPVVFYLASPLFISTTVSEPRPQNVGDVLASGQFVNGDDFHRTSGTVGVLLLADGSRQVRLENFRTINGPDLYVYLSTDTRAVGFLNLGRLKGNIGDQNYPVPPGSDLAQYRFVLIWCRQFSILFGSAELE